MAATAGNATVDDLYRTREKAELVGGRLRIMEASGFRPGMAAAAILVSLRAYGRSTGRGHTFPDGVGFLVDLPNRQSFSPDGGFYTGPLPAGLRFAEGAPIFAVAIRSEHDYGPAQEREMAEKRADYFAAGTAVVWDVDLLGSDVVRVFRDGDAEKPAAVYRRGEVAEAEPAVPGWRLPVNDLFE